MSLEGLQLGRYRLLRVVGSGGMGEIYLADDPGIHRQVAIKVIRTEVSAAAGTGDNANASYLSQREAKAVASLDHPYILPLYDYGEQQSQGAAFTYLVMPYREDGSLARWMRQRMLAGGITALDVTRIVQQAASALQYAHEHQVIHLDVKPSNFLLRYQSDKTQTPDVLLTDFGIAKLSTVTSGMSQSVRGTSTYMAPELWEGHPTPATDQYALAAMTYELMTGRPPFQGNPMQLMYAHVNTAPPPPSSINPYLSPAIDAVLLRGLAKKGEERFPSVALFASALQQALRTISPSTPLGTLPPGTLPSTKVPSTPMLGTIRATLAISEDEAQTGGRRDLTLPGGRRIFVPIPAGARDGQVIRVDDTQHTASGSSTSSVYLTLSVVQTSSSTNTPVSLYDAGATVAGQTVLSDLWQVTHISEKIPPLVTDQQTLRQQAANIDEQSTALRTPHNTPLPESLPRMPITPTLSSIGTLQYPREAPERPAGARIALLTLLVVLFIAGSGGLYYYFALAHSSTQTAQGGPNNTNNTSPATARPGQPTSITTPEQPGATATTQAGAAPGVTPTGTYRGTSPSPTATVHPRPTPSPTPANLSIAIAPSNFSDGSNCSYSANQGWMCSTTLSNTGQHSFNWSASSTGSPSVSFSPANGTLAAGASTSVTIIVGAMTICPGSATFTFADANNSTDTATAPWSCGTPTLTVNPITLDTTTSTCTRVSSGWQCAVTLDDTMGGLHWSASSKIASFSPAIGTVYPNGQVIVIALPGCTSGTLSFTGPGNTATVLWTCTSPAPTPTP